MSWELLTWNMLEASRGLRSHQEPLLLPAAYILTSPALSREQPWHSMLETVGTRGRPGSHGSLLWAQALPARPSYPPSRGLQRWWLMPCALEPRSPHHGETPTSLP